MNQINVCGGPCKVSSTLSVSKTIPAFWSVTLETLSRNYGAYPYGPGFLSPRPP